MNTKLLKQKILDLAIRGKLVPQDPNDEPASELLKRIRAEKEKLIAEGKIKRSKKTGDKPHYENIRANRMQNQTCLSSAEVQPNEGVANAPFEVPESWEWCTLAEVADIARGGSPRPIKNFLTTLSNGINWIKISDTEKGGKYINQCEQKIIPEGVRHSRFVHKGDFLLTNSMSFGRPYILNVDGCIHDGWLVISPNQGIYDKEFLYYLLSSEYAYNQFSEKASGSAVSNLNIDKVKMALFPILPLKEQARIVSTLGMWYKIIEELESEQQSLKLFTKQAKNKVLDLAIHGKLVPQEPNDEPAIELLKRINPAIKPCDISHYGNLPKSGCVVKLGDIGKWQAGGTPNRGVKEYYGGNIPWLKTGDLNDGFINKIPECITQAGLDNSSAKLNPKDSVLIAMYGATIGKIGILTFPAATNQACCACVDYPLLEKIYLFYFLLSHRDAFIMQGGGGAQPNISKEIILNTEIPLPPINEQKRIAEMITEVFSFLDKISADL